MKIIFEPGLKAKLNGGTAYFRQSDMSIHIEKDRPLLKKIRSLLHEIIHLFIYVTFDDHYYDYLWDIIYIKICPNYKDKAWAKIWAFEHYKRFPNLITNDLINGRNAIHGRLLK